MHSLWLSDHLTFMAISILVGSFISVDGIRWVVIKAPQIWFAPIVSVSNSTFAFFPLKMIVSSSMWYVLSVVGCVIFAAT